MKKLILILSILTGFGCFAQTIDSVYYSYDNNSQELSGFVQGEFIWLNDNSAISYINYSIYSDTILIKIGFIPCQTWNMFSPYDTIFSSSLILNTGNWHIKTLSIHEKNIDTSSCFYNPIAYEVDTAFFELNVPIGIKEYLESITRIFPNPINNSFIIDIPLRINSLKIYSNTGRYISSLKINDKSHDISNLKTGLYVLEIETDEGVLRKKIIKK